MRINTFLYYLSFYFSFDSLNYVIIRSERCFILEFKKYCTNDIYGDISANILQYTGVWAAVQCSD